MNAKPKPRPPLASSDPRHASYRAVYGDEGPAFNKVVNGFALVLEGLGVSPGEHTLETAKRTARAWWHELCRGLRDPEPVITTFASKTDEMVVLKQIPVRSICAHHLLPFFGEATVAYIPGTGKIIGLSKLSRLVQHYSRRPQVQEELTGQIADAVARHVMPTRGSSAGGVGVAIRANHMCMQLRGVNHAGDMLTSALRGVMREKPEVRAEFLALLHS